jgi:hypothetical protein
LAKEIIIRVDGSPYGVKGRKVAADQATSKKPNDSVPAPLSPKEKPGGMLDLTSTQYVSLGRSTRPPPPYMLLLTRFCSPSNEWQDKVIDMLGAGRTTEPMYLRATPSRNGKPSLRVATYSGDDKARSGMERDRQRRRLDDEYVYGDDSLSNSCPSSPNSPMAKSRCDENACIEKEEEQQKQLVEAVGELSLNEDEQVRYHGQASGLYILGVQERVDKRNEGGIWYGSPPPCTSAHGKDMLNLFDRRRFPGARVWPPLPSVAESCDGESSDAHIMRQRTHNTPPTHQPKPDKGGDRLLPPRDEQERLLELYFTHVQPSFPVIHKKAFWELWRNGYV